MNLTDFAKPLVAKNHFIKASFGGFSGTGKSTTASNFVAGCYKEMKLTKPVLILDNEKGIRFLEPFFSKQGIPILNKETTHIADVISSFEYLQKGEIDFLFIDSLSKVWYQFVRDYREKNRKSFMTLQDWGKIMPAWQEQFSDRFVDVSGNIVFTGRGGYSYEMEENEETHKKEFVKSGVKMKMAGETPFEPDLNVWMELEQEIRDGKLIQWREAQILKDRSGTIDGKVFKNPTFSDFKPVLNFISAIPTGEVVGATSTQSNVPTDDFEYQKKKNQREIELEKIKAEFDKAGFGSTKEEKQIKTLVIEKCFGTTSMTEIEKKPAEDLALLRESLQTFFRKFETFKMELASGDFSRTPIQFVQEYDFTVDADLPEFLQTKKEKK